MMHRNKSVNVHQFAMIPRADIPRSKFDSQKSYKTTFDSGYLIPVYVDEVLPGDTINLQMTAFARLATPLFPIMDNMHLDSFFFFVPNRLVWRHWQRFMGERTPDPDSSIDFTVPEMTSPAGGYAVNSLQDYMGLPTAGQITGSNTVTHCAFWTRAYNLIWNEWFRDENLQDSAVVDTNDGPDDPADYVLRRRGKRHDYFTSALPWPQKGDAVTLPLGSKAPVIGLYQANNNVTTRSHFGVVSPDARLQRPEYLGGGSTPVSINPVAQTSATGLAEDTSPQGNLAAFGTALAYNHGFTYNATEHGVLIGLVSVRADLTYQQGLPRMWSRSTRYDFYFPAFATLGEQAVLNKEIYCTGTATDDDVFGYQERWAEYRYKPSQITGYFRSTAAGTLDAWHLAQEFGTLPVLNDEFIEDTPPVERIVAIGDQANGKQFLFDAFFNVRQARPMPLYSVPGLIDHF